MWRATLSESFGGPNTVRVCNQLQRAILLVDEGRLQLMRIRAVSCFVILVVYSSTCAQTVQRGSAHWVGPRPDVDYRLDGYEVTERLCPDGSGNLCVYLERPG